MASLSLWTKLLLSSFLDNRNFTMRSYLGSKKLTINGVEIIPSSSMTYLGVVLDQKLNWSLHIEKKKVSKAKKKSFT